MSRSSSTADGSIQATAKDMIAIAYALGDYVQVCIVTETPVAKTTAAGATKITHDIDAFAPES